MKIDGFISLEFAVGALRIQQGGRRSYIRCDGFHMPENDVMRANLHHSLNATVEVHHSRGKRRGASPEPAPGPSLEFFVRQKRARKALRKVLFGSRQNVDNEVAGRLYVSK
ncbi:hypothetical protein LMG27174_05177 [Paraburkholderia rhynchosiae]|uniref:Uncharacterized protein n=1 Tax=Paraburkholderia rhynchosiae TaxID=487049 RepID=A0A6J5C2Z0_9BURK|nr:hypothetical protein LMG27174_05177 [Paraburkholderia rhynchosiae]